MANTYITKQGDAWDLIAYLVYGSESYTGWLMQHNMGLLDTFAFSAGTVLQTPPLPETEQSGSFPPWRAEA